MGILEYEISVEHGFDLHDVRAWPVTKKLDYQEHMAYRRQREEEAYEMDGETDMGGVSSSAGSMPSAGMGGGARGLNDTSGNFHGRKDIHPDLRKYNTHIDVVGEDDDGGGDGDRE